MGPNVAPRQAHTDVTTSLCFLLGVTTDLKNNVDTLDAAQVDRYAVDGVARESLSELLADYDEDLEHLVSFALPEWKSTCTPADRHSNSGRRSP